MFFVKMRENFTLDFEIILKIDQNTAFFVQFSKQFLKKFLKDFPNNCVFRPKGENLTQGFLIFRKIA